MVVWFVLHSRKGDTLGNLVFRGTARNFNPECARAAKITIAEVEELVGPGELSPDSIHLPGIFVHRIIRCESNQKRVERTALPNVHHNRGDDLRDRIVRRVVKEFKDGMYINLGIGIPTMAVNSLPPNIRVDLQSENGMLGM